MGTLIGTAIGIPFQQGALVNYLPYADLQTLVNSKITEKLTGNNITFDGAGNWVTGLGSLAADVSTYPGNLYLNCTSGNQCVKIVNVITVTTKAYLVKIRCKIASGAGTTLQIGSFSSSVVTWGFKITPTTSYKWYYGYVSNFLVDAGPNFYIGVEAATNNGTKFLIDEIHIGEVTLTDFYGIDLSKQAKHYTDGLWSGLSKAAQTMLQLNVMGDSILANPMGTIPVGNDEGDTMRPTRLTSNNVIRQLYDARKYNAPIYRRLDHADWTKSTLSGSNDFVEEADTVIFGAASNSKYFVSTQANSYVEITVPNGYRNFAVIFASGNPTTWEGHISITLNGGDISAYGFNVLSSAIDYTVNGHKVYTYQNLPAGNNTIRFTKSNNAKPLHFFGGCYWTGNTLKINNNAIGGQDIITVKNVVNSILSNEHKANWIIEFPNMNNCSHGVLFYDHINSFMKIVNSARFEYANTVFITTHPFGKNPSDQATNYYSSYSNPNFKQRSVLDIAIAVYMGVYFVDLFGLFEVNTIARGGTIAGGDPGLYYTVDGQHLDEEGTVIFENFLNPKLPQLPE